MSTNAPEIRALFVPVANYPEVRNLPGCANATSTCAIGLATNQGLRRQLGGGFDGIKPETGKGWSVGADFAPELRANRDILQVRIDTR